MRFTKMQGLGNDYVYLDCTKDAPRDLSGLAKKISDRHFGVGSDGLICIFPSQKADFQMRMFNADGSEGEMCGNGIRCVGKFVYDKELTNQTTITVETLAGTKTLKLGVGEGKVSVVTADMGIPQWEKARTIHCEGREYRGIPVSMGNPHFVIPVESVKGFDLRVISPLTIPNPIFPNGVNAEISEVVAPDHVLMRVWERGSGETLACGTGACATVAALVSEGLIEREVTVSLLGGDLRIRWEEADGHIYMTGPAVTVFEGDWPEENEYREDNDSGTCE